MNVANFNVLVHSCFSQRVGDPRPAKCQCKKFITYREAKDWVGSGLADWLIEFSKTSDKVYEVFSAVVEERGLKTPRSNTLERAHMERNVEGNEEQADSVEAYLELTQNSHYLLMRGVLLKDGAYYSGEPILFDPATDAFRGRPILIFFGLDERTRYSGSVR